MADTAETGSCPRLQGMRVDAQRGGVWPLGASRRGGYPRRYGEEGVPGFGERAGRGDGCEERSGGLDQ